MRHGQAVVQREVVDGFVWSAIPVREVDTGDDRIGLYRAPGTECWWPSHPRRTHVPAHQVTQAPRTFEHMSGQLTLVGPADDHSVTVMWDEGWVFRGWYIDVIRPYRATPIGWDFADLHLDLVVMPDLTASLKDADELANAVAHGEISAAEAANAHERCGQLAEAAAARVGVFSERWAEWRPDPSWRVPRLSTAAGSELGSSPTSADHRLDVAWWLDS
jgi:uncharacterized protein